MQMHAHAGGRGHQDNSRNDLTVKLMPRLRIVKFENCRINRGNQLVVEYFDYLTPNEF